MTATGYTATRYNARIAEVHWQRVWHREGLFAAEPAAAAAGAAGLSLEAVRRCVIADASARFRRAVYSATAAAGNHATSPDPTSSDRTSADPLLRTLAVAFAAPDGAAGGRRGPDPDRRDPAGPDAAELADAYGADATRWFLVSAASAEADAAAAGIHGAWRFVHRVWRLVNTAAGIAPPVGTAPSAAVTQPAREVRRSAHRAIARVSANLGTGRLDLAVAGVHGFARVLQGVVSGAAAAGDRDLKIAVREAAEILVQLFNPVMPHLAEECWAGLGHRQLLAVRRWPQACAALLVDTTVTLPVHVDGRRRGEVAVARDAPRGDIAASVLALAAVRRALAGRAPRKVIVVPQRIINVVA